MAVNQNFNAAVIYKPGAYSKTTIDLGGNFPLGATGIVGIIGESGSGNPGLLGPFRADQMNEIRAIYGSGNIVDACQYLFAPAADAAIPSGANAIYVYKTNASTQASLTLTQDDGMVRSLEYGIGGNRITYDNSLTVETNPVIASTAKFAAQGAMAAGEQFTIRVNGSTKLTFTAPAAFDGTETKAAFVAALQNAANWSSDPALVLLSISDIIDGGDIDVATHVILEFRLGDLMDTGLYATHRLGYGRVLELETVDATLANMNLTAGLAVAAAEPTSTITLVQTRDAVSHVGTVGGNVVLRAGYFEAAATSASIAVDANTVTLTVVGGAAPGATVFQKNSLATIGDLVAMINARPNWTAAAGAPAFALLPLSALDFATVGAMSDAAGLTPARIKGDANDTMSFINACPFAFHIPASGSYKGLFDDVSTTYLSGGALSATSEASIAAGFQAFTKVRMNAVVPLFSRDASKDILDGLTDAGSSYTIAGVHGLLKTHLSFVRTTKARSERQGYASIKDTYENCKAASFNQAFGPIQLWIQDVKQVDSVGRIKWFQPWMGACMLAGARAGAPIGTPMTFKYLNMVGARHTAQAMTTADANVVTEFDPDTQYDDAIIAGVTFVEHPQSGGYRVVVDNTTYGKDGNWVLNRGSVLYTADVLAWDWRNQLEAIYVGRKNTVTVGEVTSTCTSLLTGYLGQGMLVAPGWKNLSVRIDGSTINVSVTVVLVEGIEFILSDIVVTRAS